MIKESEIGSFFKYLNNVICKLPGDKPNPWRTYKQGWQVFKEQVVFTIHSRIQQLSREVICLLQRSLQQNPPQSNIIKVSKENLVHPV